VDLEVAVASVEELEGAQPDAAAQGVAWGGAVWVAGAPVALRVVGVGVARFLQRLWFWVGLQTLY